MSINHPKRIFKALCYCLLLASAVIGCGGGGGGDDRDSVPQLCRSYCSFACSKAAGCGLFPASQVSTCDDSCIETIAANGTTSAACDEGGRRITRASCSELRQILGLRNLDNDSEATLKQGEDSEAVAVHSGAEFATSATEQVVLYPRRCPALLSRASLWGVVAGMPRRKSLNQSAYGPATHLSDIQIATLLPLHRFSRTCTLRAFIYLGTQQA